MTPFCWSDSGGSQDSVTEVAVMLLAVNIVGAAAGATMRTRDRLCLISFYIID